MACYQLFGSTLWLAASLAVSFAIVIMLVTKTLHPPGGATALIAVIGGTKVHSLGYLYALIPQVREQSSFCSLLSLSITSLCTESILSIGSKIFLSKTQQKPSLF